MRDIDIAKKLLLEQNLSIVFVKKGKIIYKSRERGIKPLYIAITTIKKEIENCSAADKVVGKAAAKLYAFSNINDLYCNVITKSAKELLNEKDIKISYDISIEYVENRKKDGMCPVEKIARDEVEFKELLDKIKIFLINNNLINK